MLLKRSSLWRECGYRRKACCLFAGKDGEIVGRGNDILAVHLKTKG